MLQAEQNRKDDTAIEEGRLLACQNNRQDQETVHKPIVLEVDMVDNEEPGRQEDRKTGNVGEMCISGRHGFDEPKQRKQISLRFKQCPRNKCRYRFKATTRTSSVTITVAL